MGLITTSSTACAKDSPGSNNSYLLWLLLELEKRVRGDDMFLPGEIRDLREPSNSNKNVLSLQTGYASPMRCQAAEQTHKARTVYCCPFTSMVFLFTNFAWPTTKSTPALRRFVS